MAGARVTGVTQERVVSVGWEIQGISRGKVRDIESRLTGIAISPEDCVARHNQHRRRVAIKAHLLSAHRLDLQLDGNENGNEAKRRGKRGGSCVLDSSN
jgi:hypothetical protein